MILRGILVAVLCGLTDLNKHKLKNQNITIVYTFNTIKYIQNNNYIPKGIVILGKIQTEVVDVFE